MDIQNYSLPAIGVAGTASYLVAKRMGFARPWAPPLAIGLAGMALAGRISSVAVAPTPSAQPTRELDVDQLRRGVEQALSRATQPSRHQQAPNLMLYRHLESVVPQNDWEVAQRVLEIIRTFENIDVCEQALTLVEASRRPIGSSIDMVRSLVPLEAMNVEPCLQQVHAALLDQVKQATWQAAPSQNGETSVELDEFKKTEAKYGQDLTLFARNVGEPAYATAVERMRPFQILVAAVENHGALIDALNSREYAEYVAAHVPILRPITTVWNTAKPASTLRKNEADHYTIKPAQQLPHQEMLLEQIDPTSAREVGEMLTILDSQMTGTQ